MRTKEQQEIGKENLSIMIRDFHKLEAIGFNCGYVDCHECPVKLSSDVTISGRTSGCGHVVLHDLQGLMKGV